MLNFQHRHDRKLTQSEFYYIQRACGKEFTHEAYVFNDKHAQCESYNQKLGFLDFDCIGHHVWIDAPYAETAMYLLHFVQAKQKSPYNTSACVMLPEWAVPNLRPLLKGWERVFTYQKGAKIYEVPCTSKSRMPGIPWAMQVWHSPTALPTDLVRQINEVAKDTDQTWVDDEQMDTDSQSESGDEAPELTFLFSAKLAGMTKSVLMDSGGTIEFMSKAAAQRAGLTVKPDLQSVKIRMGDDFVQSSYGTVTSKIHLQGLVDTVTFHVIDMVEGVDIILGNQWLRKRRVVLNWGSKTATVRKGCKVFTLHPQHVSGNTLLWSANDDVQTQHPTFQTLSYAEALRHMAYGIMAKPNSNYSEEWE